MLGNTGSHLNFLFLQAVTCLGLSCEALPTCGLWFQCYFLYFSFVVLFWLTWFTWLCWSSFQCYLRVEKGCPKKWLLSVSQWGRVDTSLLPSCVQPGMGNSQASETKTFPHWAESLSPVLVNIYQQKTGVSGSVGEEITSPGSLFWWGSESILFNYGAWII